MIARLEELWEDLRWALRRAVDRLREGRPGPLSRDQLIRSRRVVALAVLVLALFAVFRFVSIPSLPCDVSPAKTCRQTDHAIALVPAGSDAYLHINLDRDSSQFSTASEVTGELPHAEQIAQGIFRTLRLAPGLDLQRDARTWIGDELGFAALRSGRSLALLSIGDQAGARRFLARVGRGKPRPAKGGPKGLRVYRNGLAYAELEGFLALGSATAVRSAIDTAKPRGKPLSDSEAADDVLDSLPAQRLADAYLSPRGIDRLLAGRGGFASQLDILVDFSASRGLSAALVAGDDGLELQLDSKLGAAKVKAHPGFFQAFPSFDPSLAGEFSPDTLLYLDIADPGETVQALLRQASFAAPGLVAAFNRFEGQLRRGGVDLERGVLPVLGGEAAAGFVQGRSAPYLTFVFADVDEDAATAQMAQLQAPLIAALSPARTGQAPSFEAKRLDDTVMRRVRISPNLSVAYAIFDRKLVVSTNPEGVRQAVEGDEDLGGSDSFRTATSGTSGGVSALVFLNLERLVRRAGPLGLEQIVEGFSADVEKLKALGLTVRSDDESLKTKLFLDIE